MNVSSFDVSLIVDSPILISRFLGFSAWVQLLLHHQFYFPFLSIPEVHYQMALGRSERLRSNCVSNVIAKKMPFGRYIASTRLNQGMQSQSIDWLVYEWRFYWVSSDNLSQGKQRCRGWLFNASISSSQTNPIQNEAQRSFRNTL